jgi:hypothetical protein
VSTAITDYDSIPHKQVTRTPGLICSQSLNPFQLPPALAPLRRKEISVKAATSRRFVHRESGEHVHIRMNHQIIPLYMPSHPSNHLQPLDVGCFAPLKKAYGIQVMKRIQRGTYYINKKNVIDLYKEARKALLSKNICSGFGATGLVPLKPQRVLDKLIIKHITPPTTAHGPLDGVWVAKTPLTTAEVQKQMELIKQLINYNL